MTTPPPILQKPDLKADQDSALAAAHGAIRRYCGWHVAPSITETLTLNGNGGSTILLPSKHVTAVTEVLIEDQDATTLADWGEEGTLELLGRRRFPRRRRSVKVTLTHGYPSDEVPEIADLIRTLAARAIIPASDKVQRAAGPFSERRQARSDGLLGGLGLFESEKDQLAPYRLNWGV